MIGNVERADRDSLDWLRYLTHRIGDAPMVMVASVVHAQIGLDHPAAHWLDQAVRESHTQWISLSPLTPDQMRLSMAGRLGQGVGRREGVGRRAWRKG